MFGQQRQTLDVKPLPPPPPKMFEEKVENDDPRSNTTSDQKETSGLFKKLASKLKYPTTTGQFSTTSTPAKPTTMVRVKKDFTSKEQREAALRERGLVASPRKDLSQVEQDLDQRYAKTSPTPQDQTAEGGQPSAAERIMQEWKAKNQAGRL